MTTLILTSLARSVAIVSLGVAAIASAQTPNPAPSLGTAPKGFDERREKIEHGKLSTIEYDSKTTGGKRKMVVYSPPQPEVVHDSPAYPVLYLLHGMNFDETGWTTSGLADVILDNLYADKKAVPMIVVMPNGFAARPGSTRPRDNSAFEDELLKDIVPYVEAHFPAKADREHRALVGQSMGGGQALNIGLKHLDVFATVGGLSPAAIPPANQIPNPADASKKMRLFWLSCGDQDGLLTTAQSFHTALDDKKVPHLWHIGSGAHNFTVWKSDLYLLAQKLFREDGDGLKQDAR